MKLTKPIGLTEFNKLEEAEDSGVTKPSIITKLLDALGSREAAIFTLDYGGFGGLSPTGGRTRPRPSWR
jgi:hypothetical protein